MGFDVEVSISALTVFLQGIFSFFSPCVLPLVPLYIGYLSGGAKTVDEKGVIRYRRGKVMVNTVGFVLGVSFAFFLLGFGFTAAGQFFSKSRDTPGIPRRPPVRPEARKGVKAAKDVAASPEAVAPAADIATGAKEHRSLAGFGLPGPLRGIPQA